MFSLVNSLIVDAQSRRQQGQGMVEYGLILALVSVIAAAALSPLGTQIAAVFTGITTTLGGA